MLKRFLHDIFSPGASPDIPQVIRLDDGPIITPEMLPGTDGENINGPSLIKAPSWLQHPLGKYYLYFAHHKGLYIRLAFANNLKGPWTIYQPGTLHVSNTPGDRFPNDTYAHLKHVASPDVHVDPGNSQIVMYYHTLAFTGGEPEDRKNYRQVTLRAVSEDGLHFTSDATILGGAYFRVFKWENQYFALSRLGKIWKSPDGISPFEAGPNPFLRFSKHGKLRHAAVAVHRDRLMVYYSRIGDTPESIVCSEIMLAPDWSAWKASKPRVVLMPEAEYEGASLPLLQSARGMSNTPARQLRDPAIFEEDGRTFLLYCVKGEFGIAIAEVIII